MTSLDQQQVMQDWYEMAPTAFLRGLKTLSYRERGILEMRLGIGDDYSYTVEALGRIFKVTRERVRQVEAKAYRKMVTRMRIFLNRKKTSIE